MSLFSYPKLPDADSIRLVELLPDQDKAQIKILIHTSRIRDRGKYEALSYVWGPPNVTVEIKCNDKVLKVSESLKIALHRFRLKTSSRKLWIDQICIDQSNDVEQMQQVWMIRQIYSEATTVLAWLGPIDSTTASNAKDLVQVVSDLNHDIIDLPPMVGFWMCVRALHLSLHLLIRR
jgi:hypothetical protein